MPYLSQFTRCSQKQTIHDRFIFKIKVKTVELNEKIRKLRHLIEKLGLDIGSYLFS